MPTTKLVYLDASATGANDGTSLTDAYESYADMITGEAGDLVTLDRKLRVRHYGTTTQTANLSFTAADSWVTNHSTGHYIEIVAGPGYYATSEYSASNARLDFSSGGLSITRDVVFEGIQIRATRVAASQTLASIGPGGAGAVDRVEFKNCHLLYAGTGGSSNLCVSFTGNVGLYMQNCIVRDWPQACIDNNRSGGVSYIYNNTFADNLGIVLDWAGASSDLIVAKANLFSGNTTDAAGTFASGTDYNASDNASIGYTVTGGAPANDRLSQTFTFESGTDYRLAAGDTGGRNQGPDLKSDSDYPVLVDITNTVRPDTTTDIGAVDDPDTTPPVLSLPTTTSVTGSGAVVGGTTNEIAGTIYCVVTTRNTAPTTAQIVAGQDDLGAAAEFAGEVDISSSGATTFNATADPAGVTYYPYIFHLDPGSNSSNILSNSSFLLVPTVVTFGSGNQIRNGVDFPITGDGFEATQGAATVELITTSFSDLATVNSYSDGIVRAVYTQPAVAAVPFTDKNYTITGRLTTDGGLVDDTTVNHLPASGINVYPLSAANADVSAGSVFAGLSIVDADQFTAPASYDGGNLSWEVFNGEASGRFSTDGSGNGSFTITLREVATGNVSSSVVTTNFSSGELSFTVEPLEVELDGLALSQSSFPELMDIEVGCLGVTELLVPIELDDLLLLEVELESLLPIGFLPAIDIDIDKIRFRG